MGVKIADKLEQFNNGTYYLVDSSAVEYKQADGSSISVQQALENGVELTKENVEGLLGLTKEEIEAMADLILDTEVRIDKTYSSSKIYTDIQQCLEDSKTYTLEELGKKIGASYEVVTSIDDMVSQDRLYLLNNGNNYDIYIVDVDNVPVVIGDTSIDLSGYVTKTEIESELGTETLSTTSQTVKGAINELFQSVTNNEEDTTDLENRITTNETNITDLQEQLGNLDIPEEVDLTEINDKLAQLENNQIKKLNIIYMEPNESIYKITPPNKDSFSKILITDLYGGCILITGSLVPDYKSFKVVRLSNGYWDAYLPAYEGANKILNVYYDGSFIYVKFGNYVKFHVEGGFTNIEKITSIPTDATELPIADLTKKTDLTEINTKLAQLENNQIKKMYLTDMSGGVVYYKIPCPTYDNFSKILMADYYGGCILITGTKTTDTGYKTFKVVRLSNGYWHDYSSSNNTSNKIQNVYLDGSYIYVKCSNYFKLYIEGGFSSVEKLTSLPTEVTELPILDLTQGNSADLTDINDRLTQLENTTSGGNTNNDVYSTEEQAVGTWINGKTLYRRTFENYSISGSAGNSFTTLSRDFSERCIVRVEGVAELLLNNNNPILFPLPLVYERTNSDGGGYDYVTVRMGSTNYQLNLVWNTKTSKVTGYSVSVYFYKENE